MTENNELIAGWLTEDYYKEKKQNFEVIQLYSCEIGDKTIKIANQNQQLYLDNKDIDVEYDKEMKRIKAREKVKEDLNGSV
jgi:hypothetical protein